LESNCKSTRTRKRKRRVGCSSRKEEKQEQIFKYYVFSLRPRFAHGEKSYFVMAFHMSAELSACSIANGERAMTCVRKTDEIRDYFKVALIRLE
jgi:hypothetical protein